MAGSYNHIVAEEDGRLLNGEGINGMLECMSGDVVECVTEMYGMIWFLADGHASDVKRAQEFYKLGLAISPGVQSEFEGGPDE